MSLVEPMEVDVVLRFRRPDIVSPAAARGFGLYLAQLAEHVRTTAPGGFTVVSMSALGERYTPPANSEGP